MADEFPRVEVIGIDLAPIQSRLAPNHVWDIQRLLFNGRSVPPNCT